MMQTTCLQVRGFPCDCSFPAYCDSQLAPLAPTRLALARMALKAPEGGVAAAAAGREGPAAEQQQQQGRQEEQQQAQQHSDGDDAVLAAAAAADPALDRQLAALEAQHVHAVYNAIAPHFASTRFAVWPRVRAFLEGLPPGALIADVGCGNGAWAGLAAARIMHKISACRGAAPTTGAFPASMCMQYVLSMPCVPRLALFFACAAAYRLAARSILHACRQVLWSAARRVRAGQRPQRGCGRGCVVTRNWQGMNIASAAEAAFGMLLPRHLSLAKVLHVLCAWTGHPSPPLSTTCRTGARGGTPPGAPPRWQRPACRRGSSRRHGPAVPPRLL